MTTELQAVCGILIPFFGTAAGAAAVFFKKKDRAGDAEGALSAFAAGVMLAASVWSLLLPAIERAETSFLPQFLPPALGVTAGALFCLLLDRLLPGLSKRIDALPSGKKKTALLIWAVTVHNLPEGMAVGVLWAGVLNGNAVAASGAFALSLGIALQNIPEGAIVSLPAAASGAGKGRSFVYGVLSGAVEPAGAALTLLLTSFVGAILPYTLSFAAGAMICVAACELLPEIGRSTGKKNGALLFIAGFIAMMSLDVALG